MGKNFEELLLENQISMPRTTLGKYLFKKRWEAVKYNFDCYCSEREEQESKWEKERKWLSTTWEKDFPKFDELVPIKFGFKTAKAANEQISRARRHICNLILVQIRLELEYEARKEWIEKIVAQAPENCILIVVKDTSYVPHDYNALAFEKAVEEQKKPNAIICMSVSAMWVAFDPRDEYNCRYWGMKPKTSKIEYICSE
jgi:hypothetical protein